MSLLALLPLLVTAPDVGPPPIDPAEALTSPPTAERGDASIPLADPSSDGTRRFRCDGTDAAFFEEMNAAGTLGYGETWDAHVCDEGVAIYGEGATSRWRDLRRRPMGPTDREQMLALVMPMVAIGGLFFVVLAAFTLALVARWRRAVVLDATCRACDASIPIPSDGGAVQHLFCPMCGAPCTVDVTGRGKAAVARTRPA
jgi:hypothetical protein